MTLQKSETVDHPRKREKKTQNTDSHNRIKLELPTQLERTMTNHIKIRAQHKIPKMSEENQAMDMEVFGLQVILCLKVPVEINLPCLVQLVET